MASGTLGLLRRGFRKRCAVCGSGHLFRRWVVMVDTCPRCGLHFCRIPGHWLGSWFLNIVAVQTSVVAVLVIGVATTYPDVPLGLVFGIAFVVAVGVPILFFPFSRTIWTAIDLAMRPLTFDEGVAPGFELDAEVEAEERLHGHGPAAGPDVDPPEPQDPHRRR